MIFIPCLAWTQPASDPPLPPHVWGAATNGISGGLRVNQSDWYCSIDIRNVTTNELYIWIAPLKKRYEIELRGPNGEKIPQLKSFLPIQNAGGDSGHIFGRRPYNSQDPLAEKGCLGWFYLKETFDIRTNGLHSLILSVRANAFTNFGEGRAVMRKEPSYFLLPPVTNMFNIPLEALKK